MMELVQTSLEVMGYLGYSERLHKYLLTGLGCLYKSLF